MRRVTLLAFCVFLLSAMPSFAAIAFYSSSTSWLAALTPGAIETFGTGTVSSWNAISTYNSTATGAFLGDTYQNYLMPSTLLSSGPGSMYIAGPSITVNLGSGPYLDMGDVHQDYSGGYVLANGTETQDLINGAWVDEANPGLTLSYGGGAYQQEQQLTITPPAGQSGLAFSLAAWAGGLARSVAVTVTTVGGLNQTFYGLAAYQSLTFFGFAVDSGDTLSSVTVTGLLSPVSAAVGPAYVQNGNTRSRTFSSSEYSYYDDYALAIDNLQFGTPLQGSGGGGDTGGDGTVPESSTFLLAGTGLVAAGLLSRKRR